MSLQSFRERMKIIMAESKGKVVQTAKNSKDSKIWSLICAAKEVSAETDGIQSYDNLVKEKVSMEKKCRDLNQKLEAEKQITASLFKTFEERHLSFQESRKEYEAIKQTKVSINQELNATKKREAELQQLLRTAQIDSKSDKAQNAKLTEERKKSERDCQSWRRKCEEAEVELASKKDEVDQLNDIMGKDSFHDVDEASIDEFGDELQTLYKDVHACLGRYLLIAEANKDINSTLNSLRTEYKVPLPTGTSREAILLRQAAGEAVFCRALQVHVFHPFYLTDDLMRPAEKVLDFLQRQSAEGDEQVTFRYHMIRALIASEAGSQGDVETEDLETGILTFLIQRRVDSAMKVIGDLNRLVPSSRLTNFTDEMERLVVRAVELWCHNAQMARQSVRAETPMGRGLQMVGTQLSFGNRTIAGAATAATNGTTSATGQARASIAVAPAQIGDVETVLFPRVTVKSDKGVLVIHGGMVLWADQEAVVAGRGLAAPPPSPTMARSGIALRNGRRLSTSLTATSLSS